MFQRKIYEQIKKWKTTQQGKTSLLIEGQRRVGKSTVVEAFAQKEYQSYILIDFSTCSQDIRNLFLDISDLNYFFLQLQLLTGTRLSERNSLIIFDEVQLFPLARQAIKQLVKDHRYDYIETGSLISIRKNIKNILIPSEEQHIPMYPMDFEEFLWALNDTLTPAMLRHLIQTKTSGGEAVHRNLMRSLRLYMLIGGMPQAVETYLESNNFEEVDHIKRNILQLYKDDFYKIDATGRLSQLFDAIPAQLNKNNSRYIVSNILPHMRPGNSLDLIAELIASRTVLASYHISQPSPELSSYKDLTRFKLYLSDTGLFTTLMFKNKSFTENDIYKKLLSDKLSSNLGYIYENIVAQMLTSSGYSLYYHTFPNETGTKKYEIDFLISKKNKICPIEVKSSGYRTHASLDAFHKRYSAHILKEYLLYTKDIQKDHELFLMPVYLTPFL